MKWNTQRNPNYNFQGKETITSKSSWNPNNPIELEMQHYTLIVMLPLSS